MSSASRRAFLRTAALAGAGALLEGCGRTPSSPVHDVVILGAGMAGLSAARDLARAGLDVVVLEARERVGGRMESLGEPAPHGIEIGAQMIHGSRASTWELIREFGIDTRPFIPWSRWSWSPERGFREPDMARVEKATRRLHEAYAAYRGEDLSFQQFLDASRIPAEEQALVAHYALSWSAETDEISLRSAMEDTPAWDAYLDNNYQVVGGYGLLARRLAGELGDRVRLQSPAAAVDWKPASVTITCEREGKKETTRARRCVITLPIGVLQAGGPVFTPDLPAWKRRSIDALRMGRVVVLHFLFDDWFWRHPAPGVPGWNTRSGRISFWDPHPKGKGMPALEGWITGAPAQELSDMGKEAGLRRALEWIEQAFPRSQAGRRVQWSSFRDWVRDPCCRGSYSFSLPGGSQERSALATPVRDTLYFAGEATERPPHYQTVHGAHSSGRRAAREILASIGADLGA
jgi:monoamine oxidase